MMMQRFRLSLALVCVSVVLLAASSASAKTRVGDRAAAFVQVLDAKGKRVSLKQYRDKVVVLTFGASWCAPCKKELPALEKLSKKFDAKKVVFLAVNIDTKASKGKQFMSNAGLSRVKALFDSKKSTVASYDPPKMPSLFVIRRGIVKHVHEGFSSGDEVAIAKAIKKEVR